MSQCPPALFAKLTLNGLMPDEATDRQGNCGIDAFARSLMTQMKDNIAAGPSASARNRRNLKNSVNKVDLLRRVGVSWLEANAAEMIWPGMTVAKLCCAVSGWSFQEYLANMRQDREWADLAFLHALGRAHGVNVVIFQAHILRSMMIPSRCLWPWSMITISGGSYHADTRLQWMLSTRVSMQRCVHMWVMAGGVRAYVLTRGLTPPMSVTAVPPKKTALAKTGSFQR